MGRANIFIGIIAGCVFLLAGCGGETQIQMGEKEPDLVTGAAVTSSAVAEEQKPQETDTDTENIFNNCATTDLSLKKMNNTVTEIKLGIPESFCDYFYVKNNSEVIADVWGTPESELDPPIVSYVLVDNKWEEKQTPFDVAREREDITWVKDVVQRANGDYVFVSGGNVITRMSEKGKIKQQLSSKQLFPGFIAAMEYLGDGKAIIQTQDDHFRTSVYEQQDESIIHLYLVNIKTGRIEKTYPVGWRLCGSTDGKSFFIENGKRIAKVKIKTGEMVKKYSTEAIWSQGWSDETTDYEGIFFHDRGITWCIFDGNLYAKHVGGVFQLDEEELCWKQLISRQDDFAMGPMYNNVFVMLDKNKLMLMGYCTDDECATDCYMYEWK